MSRSTLSACAAGLLALLLAAYANHFHNGFHFDDGHAVVENPFLRDPRNIPRFFADATTFSVLPTNQSYRPILSTTLAVDYRLGGGYDPVAFQASTFAWYLLQLGAMFLLFASIAHAGDAGAAAAPVALLAVALYALHPVCAETVNYVIQRGEVLSTLGVVAGLALYARAPGARRYGLYLLPVAFAALAKPPALVFPALLFAYVRWFGDRDGGPTRALVAAAPSALASVALGVWLQAHTPPTYVAGAASRTGYWLTQPFVALRYFASFFAPVHLSADNDWGVATGVADARVAIGATFIAALVWATAVAGRRRATRPIAFGLCWFLLALLPTSALPLAEVGNDHRMFFPFVGLTLAVAWAAWLAWSRVRATAWRGAAAAVLVIGVLAAEAVGVRARNEVWRSEETLWYDVTRKSPTNGRGLMNYGLTRMEQGDYRTAITSFEQALRFTPAYALLRTNLAIAYGGLERAADAEREFGEAIRLAPDDWRPHMYYGRWLLANGRIEEAVAALELAHTRNPVAVDAEDLRQQARARARDLTPTPERYLTLSLAQYRAGQFRKCIASAQQALALDPAYAEAYNNVAAAHNALAEWDDGIAAAEQAVRLKPDLELARNNLAWARGQKAQRP